MTFLQTNLRDYLPSPLYAGTAVTCYEQFAKPVFAVPPNEWPLADPTTVTLTFVDPSGTTTVWTYLGAGSIIKVSTGVYSAEIPTTSLVGNWTTQWEGTGACATIASRGFTTVEPPL